MLKLIEVEAGRVDYLIRTIKNWQYSPFIANFFDFSPLCFGWINSSWIMSGGMKNQNRLTWFIYLP